MSRATRGVGSPHPRVLRRAGLITVLAAVALLALPGVAGAQTFSAGGTVTAPLGVTGGQVGFTGVCVVAVPTDDVDGSGPDSFSTAGAWVTEADPSGDFGFDQLSAGTSYYIGFNLPSSIVGQCGDAQPNNIVESAWYDASTSDGTPDFADATPVSASTDIGINLEAARDIAGTMATSSGAAGIRSVLADAQAPRSPDLTTLSIISTQSNVSGQYLFMGLWPGLSYLLTFNVGSPIENSNASYASILYYEDGHPEGTPDPLAATPVPAGSSSVDFTLSAGSTISGHVTGASGTGGMCIEAVPYESLSAGESEVGQPTDEVAVGSDGSYTLYGVLAGAQYSVVANAVGCIEHPTDAAYPTESFYDAKAPSGAPNGVGATAVVPPATGIDFVLGTASGGSPTSTTSPPAPVTSTTVPPSPSRTAGAGPPGATGRAVTLAPGVRRLLIVDRLASLPDRTVLKVHLHERGGPTIRAGRIVVFGDHEFRYRTPALPVGMTTVDFLRGHDVVWTTSITVRK
ncbi:MAG TPA: hypothetical protein VMD59_05075 [Acidimicrobiales bacterium]|nr:hypothetical protein [Acidimicrobiales bacterium]